MLLEIDNLTVHYGKALALEEVAFSIEEGELLAVIGPNGAGKTTLMRTVSGLMKPTTGKVSFDGVRISGRPSHEIARQGIIQCPEGRRLFPDMTVLDNLLMGTIRIREKRQVRERLGYVYELFPILEERSKQVASTLSGGQQQMLAIGRALMVRPKLLLLDEPSVGLAPKVVQEIFEKIGIVKKSGVTILLVEQNVDVALAVADRLAILDHGKTIFSGTSSELLSNTSLSEVYLGLA